MVQKSSEFSTQQLREKITQTLGQHLSEQELSNCIKQIEIKQPSAGKPFWQTTDATVGIYIILAGKVRLLDSADNLIASVGAGASFGELTLFCEEQFQPYSARASVNLKLCYIPAICLRSLIRKYPSIGQHLHTCAVTWDLLLLCRQTLLSNAPVESVMQTLLLLLEQHNLQIGNLPSSLLKNQQLWILRRGELLHSSGLMLSAGNIYVCSQLPKERGWQVTQPTQLYSLDRSDWETAITNLPKLAELINSDISQVGDGQTGRKPNPTSKIQHPKPPEQTIERRNHKKISQANGTKIR